MNATHRISARLAGPGPQPHLLVVDDHGEIRKSLEDYLRSHGYRVSTARDGPAARAILATSAIDLVVLDIMMPGEDGLSLCRHLRESGSLPVIMLTALAEDMDRVLGLEMGADDYLTKPFNPRELVARIKAVLRRAHSLPPRRQTLAAERVRFEHWELDARRRELIGVDGVSVPLSTAEFALLTAFLNHPRIVLSRDRLLDLTRGRDAGVFDRSIDNQVSRLRKKIELEPRHPTMIITHRGGGYSFEAKVDCD